MTRRAIAIVVGILIMIPSLALAGSLAIPGFYGKVTTLPAVPANTVPVQLQGGVTWGASVSQPAANEMVIYQTQPKAVIDWQSFNIGSNASVYFNQRGNSTWAALNRIWDLSPTQIYGSLKADGQVYLINQNGILFGPGSQIDVHTLIASSLNLNVDNWLNNGTLAFNTSRGAMSAINPSLQDQFYNPGQAPGVVTNGGTIQTDNLGSVFLIGSQAENSGTILSPMGQIGLVAGTDVELDLPSGILGSMPTYPGGETRTVLLVQVNNSPSGAVATNFAGGLLAADTGLVGMYGRVVNQDGVIRSVTAVERGGHVELFASDMISTGPGSLISLPVSDSPDQFDTSFLTRQGSVTFSGLDPNNPGSPQVYPNLIVHDGTIVAPSSLVTMNATSRVYLGAGSVIDVSGLWVDEPASAGVLSVQMNSVNLRDNYAQKGGVLQGQYIEMSQIAGSAIGDVSGAFATEGLTAAQRHTAGGQVNINAATGDVVAMQGSLIDFSGGGTRYGAGAVDTTKLVSGNTIYDISSANPNIQYRSILNAQTFTNSRFGITQEYNGVYYGGAFPVRQYEQAYTVGDNGGILSLQAGQVVLDGVILGETTQGLQQSASANPVNGTGNQSASGYIEPAGGQLIIGNAQAALDDGVGAGDSVNFVTRAIVVSAQAGPLLPASFQPTDSLAFSNTVLSASTLSNAGLSNVSLAANTTITVEKGAQVTVNPGGSFNAWARRIEDYGGITALGGSINLEIQTNLTTNRVIASGTNPNYIPLDEMIYIGPDATLVARGERIDNSSAGSLNQGIVPAGYTNGGSINILDETVTGQGVAVMPGALIDVSGGWQIGSTGKVTGGDAGSLSLQGYSLALDGTLQAQSLVGNKGGTISLTAGNVTVAAATPPNSYFAADDPWPNSVKGQFVLGARQLDGTGFTNITLTSVNNLIVEGGASLGPSLVKLAVPVPGSGTGDAQAATGVIIGATAAGPGVMQATADTIGASSITLRAGTSGSGLTSGFVNQSGPMTSPVAPYDALAQVSTGASVQAAPGGSITVKGPNIDVGGSLSAPSGNIALTTSYGNVTLEPGASLLAEGYNKPGTTSAVSGTAPDATPMPGGTVSLTAYQNLTLSPGSLVSVSGSTPVVQTVIGDGGTLSSVTNAGQPGAISLAAGGTIALSAQADLEGKAAMAGLPGGSLSISTTGAAPLSLAMSELARFQTAGFDALTLSSAGDLNLSNPGGLGQVAFGRSLTLSAQAITGSGADQVSVSAPWVQVTSSTLPASPIQPSAGSATMTLAGSFVDVTGSVVFSGFGSVTLAADRDIRLSDALYGSSAWSGLLKTSGDLTLQAARIYPTTLSDFTVSAGGKVTILPSGTSVDGPIYSAGGNLTIQAGGGIDQEGALAAPMGSLSLNATGSGLGGRVYLAPGSVTTTRGDASVLYGVIQEAQDLVTLGDNVWAVPDKENPTAAVPYTAVQDAPAKSISIKGDTVIVQNGALVDVSGGGSIYAYRFLPSDSGSVNPLTTAGTYVILPDNSVVLPGNAVYLTGGSGLKAGVYSLLPPQFAFLSGAMVITDMGAAPSTTQSAVTADGNPIITGYATVSGTNIRAPLLEAYELRSTSAVLSQGSFSTQTMQAGDAGSVTIGGTTTIMNGTVQAHALPGYHGGSIALSGNIVTVQASTVPLPAGFGFSTPLPAEFSGTLNVAAPSLSGQGFQTIGLGFSNLDDPAGSITANQVTLKPGLVLEAENVILAARNLITLEPGAQVLALAAAGDTGEASLISPAGKAVIGAGALVHATDAVNLETSSLDLQGTLLADHSLLNLAGSAITLVAAGATAPAGAGVFLTQSQWNTLAGVFPDIDLTSASDLIFDGAFTLSVKDALTIDAARIAALAGSTAASRVAAPALVLENTGATPSTTTNGRGTAQITFKATEMQVGPGTILFDHFSTIGLNALNNLTFRGAGSLSTGGADLSVSTARVTTSYYMEPAGPAGSAAAALSPIYTAAAYKVDAGTGIMTIASSGGTVGAAGTPGGTFEMDAGQIDVSTLVQIPSGRLTLAASGNISLDSGARLSAVGSDSAPGGTVTLTSTGGGAINVAAGAAIDVSAGSQGDAGTINLYAPTGGVQVSGVLAGRAGTKMGGTAGLGGSLSLVTNSLDTVGGVNLFSAIASKIGDFSDSLAIEASTGNITIAAADTVKARSVTITGDTGSMSLLGTIDASEPGQGGSATLYAGNSLTVTGSILAEGTGTNAKGGSVTLGVGGAGGLALNSGLINVSGTGAPETVTFQAPVTANSLNMSLAGTISGAAGVYVDAMQTYTTYNNQPISTITTPVINYIQGQTSTFMNTYVAGLKSSLLAELGGVGPSTFHLQPGIVIQSPGNLTLGSTWDLSSLRYAGEPGTLTLRAGGDLTINGNLIDNPTNNYSALLSTNAQPSWAFNLVAGARTSSPDLMAVMPSYAEGPSQGSLTISTNKVVYTETGTVRFASAGDTVINQGPENSYMISPAMTYSIGTYAGSILGNVGGNLTIEGGGAIQSATGNIDIGVGGDLDLIKNQASGTISLGSIRTTGEQTTSGLGVDDYYGYGGGGSITLDVGGAVNGDLNPNAWLAVNPSAKVSRVTPVYGLTSTEGIVTMAGGSVHVASGGSFNGQIGTFGQGDLEVYAGGDMTGRFLVKDGIAVLSAMGNFGTRSQPQLIEMSAAQVSVSAQGTIELGAALNPNLAAASALSYWDNGYTPQSSLTLTAITGDVNIYGAVDPTRYGAFYPTTTGVTKDTLLPPSVRISAGTDINVMNQQYIQLPSPIGQLSMTAGRDIVFSGNAKWLMSDADPANVYKPITSRENAALMVALLKSHAASPVHAADPAPVTISAGGDIQDAVLTLPKAATITAGGDITDLNYDGQNVRPTDVTTVAAGGNILFGSTDDVTTEKIQVGGPGYLVVAAGGRIDLGYSNGILEIGNSENPALAAGGSLIVAAGISTQMSPPAVAGFFNSLESAGTEYSTLQASGDAAGAQAAVSRARADIIGPFLGAMNPAGDIAMTASQIATTGGGGIYVLAGGRIDVGTTELQGSQTSGQTRNTGILTEAGGAISVFAAGDINVNEARIMSFMGGDIMAWSDGGNINAGKGDKATISVSAPQYSCENGVCSVTFSPPAVGSGIRALTYSPDGITPAPPAGDIYLFAPQGAIDAGEAGISGGKVILGAVTVLNVANISFSAGSVGVPTASQAVSVGTLTGSTNLADKTLVSQDTGALGSAMGAGERALQSMADAVKWLDVKFVSFDMTSPVAGGPEDECPDTDPLCKKRREKY
jgi:filamentous hemagglutinin family protein